MRATANPVSKPTAVATSLGPKRYMRLGPQGMTLSGSFTYAWARPHIVDSDILARTLLGTVELGYPLVRRQAQTIRGSIGMETTSGNPSDQD